MDNSTLWWLLTGAAVALELVSGTFYLLMLALGLAAGALAAHLGLGVSSQLVTAGVTGVVCVTAWHLWRTRWHPELPAGSNSDVNLDIGQTVAVPAWLPDGTAHVQYRGADWTVKLNDPATNATPGQYRIVRVQGSVLLVQPVA